MSLCEYAMLSSRISETMLSFLFVSPSVKNSIALPKIKERFYEDKPLLSVYIDSPQINLLASCKMYGCDL